ncbi:unnamed protein product [Orchesella dallaii]|uniref:Uncharacterized protein n=1 Tax=Orchesella dallaii TaxID=48710 RepID=A0ABP1RJ65_9HEXA
MIAEHSSEFKFGRIVVKEMLKSKSITVHLIFDGFDEVLFDQVDISVKILQAVVQLKSVKVVVSTRPHMRDLLEKTLQVLSYKMQPFSLLDQTDFLIKYWSNNGTLKICALKEFAETCLKVLRQQINDFEQEFAGIPLQCRLLAEVYQDAATKYSSPDKRVTVYNKGIVVRVKSIFEVYETFINLKLQKIFSATKTKVSKKYIVAHVYAALQLIFPETLAKKHQHVGVKTSHVSNQELLALGILEWDNDAGNTTRFGMKQIDVDKLPRFVHQTFAEYFLGLFTAEMLNLKTEFDLKLLFKKQFFDLFFHKVLRTKLAYEQPLENLKWGHCEPISSANFQYPVICYFINAHMKNTNVHSNLEPWITDPDKLYQILSACIFQGCEALYKLTSEIHKHVLEEFPSGLTNLHLLAAKFSNLELFKLVHFHVIQHLGPSPSYIASTAPKFVVTPLHVAVERGNYHLTEFLLKRYMKCSKHLHELKYVLHSCVGLSDSVVSEKQEIMRMLVTFCPGWINENLPDDTTPILQPNANIELIELLIELGANVNATNKHGCVLQRVIETEVSSEEFYKLMLKLLEAGFLNADATDSKGRTSLHLALQRLEELEDIIQLFDIMNADFNAEDHKREPQYISRYSNKVLADLKKLNLVSNKVCKVDTLAASSQSLVKSLQASTQGTFEQLCISLISCKQIQPFMQLKQCLLTDSEILPTFVTLPKCLLEFVQSKVKKAIYLLSWDIDLSIQRIRDMIDPNLTIIEGTYPVIDPSQLYIVFHRYEIIKIKSIIWKLIKLKRKVILLCNHSSNYPKEHEVLHDKFTWKDLSSDFQNHLISINTLLESQNTNNINYLKLEAELLIKFINECEFQIIKLNTHNDDNKTRCIAYPLCLCGKHPVGSGNLIWNVCRIPQRKLTCWINQVELLNEKIPPFDIVVERGKWAKLFQSAVDGSRCKIGIWRNVTKRFHLRTDQIGYNNIHSILAFSEKEFELLKKVAVNTLYPELGVNLNFHQLQCYIQIGLLQCKNSSLEFANISLAWYFIAKLVLQIEPVQFVDINSLISKLFSDCFESRNIQISHKWWWNTTFYSKSIETATFKNSVFFKFLDSIIEENLNESLKSPAKRKLTNNFATKFMQACVNGNYCNLLKVLVHFAPDHTMFDSEEMVILAVKFAAVEVIDLVLNLYSNQNLKKVTDIKIKLQGSYNPQASTTISILQVAALRGNFSVIEYLLHKQGFKSLLKTPQFKNMLHFCVLDSIKLEEENVEERKQIITLLLQLYPNFIDRKIEFKGTFVSVPKPTKRQNFGKNPLMVPNIHLKLILHLIYSGIDVNRTYNLRLENLLHLCPRYLTPEEYDELLRTLCATGETTIFHSRDKWQCTPLHRALIHLEVLDSTVDVYIAAKFDFNAISDTGNTVLHFAVSTRRSCRLLESLIRAGADVNKTTYLNRTLLHLAAIAGNLDAARCLIEHGCAVDLKDDENNKPLHLALKFHPENCNEILKLFMNHGTTYNDNKLGANGKHTPNTM